MALVIEQSNQSYLQQDKAKLEIAVIERLKAKENQTFVSGNCGCS